MFAEQEDVFYYITVHERELRAPGDAEGRGGRAFSRACTCCSAGGRGKVRVNLLGSGTILREVMAAAEILERDYGVPADIFSVPSFTELRREALDVERRNLLHPGSAGAAAVRAAVPRRSHRAVHRGDATT